MNPSERARTVLFEGIGIAGLLFSRFYAGQGQEFFRSFGGNLFFSFGAYFFMKFARLPPRDFPYVAAAYTLLGVFAQEAAQGMGLYPGWFDPLDFLFNGLGVGLALALDWLGARMAPETAS
jgi:hypothetical protein